MVMEKVQSLQWGLSYQTLIDTQILGPWQPVGVNYVSSSVGCPTKCNKIALSEYLLPACP